MAISEQTVYDLSRAVGLKLDRRRVRILTPILRQFLADLKQLDELDLGEEPLRLVFRIRRENNE